VPRDKVVDNESLCISIFFLLLRLIRSKSGTGFKDPERCALSIEDALKSIMVMEIEDNDLLRGRASNSAVYHQKDSVSMANILLWMSDPALGHQIFT